MATIMITGASSGIGRAAATHLAARGHRIIGTGRSRKKLELLSARLRATADRSDGHVVLACDQSSLADTARLARAVLESDAVPDVLIANAGVQPAVRQVTVDGNELALAVNHLSHYLLVRMLGPALADRGGRVVVTSSSSHPDGPLKKSDLQLADHWTAAGAYGRSKRANIMLSAEVMDRLGVPSSSFHPGDIRTDINRDAPFVWLAKPFERFKYAPPEKGITTMTWLATGAEGLSPRALYYVDRAQAPVSAEVEDAGLRAWLWEESERLIRATLGEAPW